MGMLNDKFQRKKIAWESSYKLVWLKTQSKSE